MALYKKISLLILVVGLISCSSNEEYIDISNDNEIDILADNDFDDIDLNTASDDEILGATLSLPPTLFNYTNVTLANYFLGNGTAQEDNTPNNNRITDNGATLGRVLFYDKQLSVNNTVSCASCHDQSKSFSDSVALSIGFNGGFTGRNSMGLANAKFYDNGRFFWDERASTLEEQVLMPIQDAVEMGLTLDELETKLQEDAYYKVLFRRAFGDETVSRQRISLALAQFIRAMVSHESKYDVGLSQTNNPRANFQNYTTSENLGKNLFFSNRTRCSDCHDSNAFVGDQARNNGLDAILTDLGVGGVTNNNNDIGEFKAPSLRNIELTGPFMHDGRFSSLSEVVEHYNSGVQNSNSLDNRLRQGNGVRRLNLTDLEKQALVDFLVTLTDVNFINDEKFSNPFLQN
jgi:cytochrome c peroxidase